MFNKISEPHIKSWDWIIKEIYNENYNEILSLLIWIVYYFNAHFKETWVLIKETGNFDTGPQKV